MVERKESNKVESSLPLSDIKEEGRANSLALNLGVRKEMAIRS